MKFCIFLFYDCCIEVRLGPCHRCSVDGVPLVHISFWAPCHFFCLRRWLSGGKTLNILTLLLFITNSILYPSFRAGLSYCTSLVVVNIAKALRMAKYDYGLHRLLHAPFSRRSQTLQAVECRRLTQEYSCLCSERGCLQVL